MQRLLPIKNVCISQYYPATNYSTSTDTSLFISRYQQPGDSYRSLLYFDLDIIKSSKEIQRAYLQLNIIRNEIQSGNINLDIYRLSHQWDNNIVTWDKMLPLASAPEYRFVIPAAWVGLIIFDITRLICNWVDHIYMNHGLILVGEEKLNSLVAFHSLRYADSSCWPQLIIT